MFQRIARLILVTVLLANQMAVCCAHSHEGESGTTPHIHLSWDADVHSHGHHHGHGHSHSHDASHSHHAPTENSSDDNDSDSNLNQDSLADQHEDGLIYCTDSNFFTQPTTDSITDSHQLGVSCESVSFVVSAADRLPHTMPEDERARYCSGIFLQIRSLRL